MFKLSHTNHFKVTNSSCSSTLSHRQVGYALTKFCFVVCLGFLLSPTASSLFIYSFVCCLFPKNISIEKEHNDIWKMLFLSRVACTWKYRIHIVACLLCVSTELCSAWSEQYVGWLISWIWSLMWLYLNLYSLPLTQSMRKYSSAFWLMYHN